MTQPDALKALLRWGVLIILLSGAMLFLQKPGSAGFVITILSLCIGATLVALVVWLTRMFQ